jgi:hypothetical protein
MKSSGDYYLHIVHDKDGKNLILLELLNVLAD